MKLIIAIINHDDVGTVTQNLSKKGFSSTRLSTTGGFLMAGNVTLLIGVEDEKVQAVMDIIREYADRYPGRVRFPHTVQEQEEGPQAAKGPLDGSDPQKMTETVGEKVIDKGPQQAYIDRSGLTDDQIKIMECLGSRTLHMDDIIEETQIPARRASSALFAFSCRRMVFMASAVAGTASFRGRRKLRA